MINVFEPSLGTDELSAVAESFSINWAGRGAKTLRFEREWAKHIGADPDQVISVNCATEGLFQICGLLEIDEGDVIIPSIHFIGAANSVLSHKGYINFCDVDRYTLNPTLRHIEEAWTVRTLGVILLHYGGVAQELDAIRQWCDDKGLWLIEDAACSPATTFRGKAAGTWGHFGVWSFDAMKILSTGDGGMIYCENPEHARELRKWLYLGMNNESGLKAPSDRWWEFEVSYPGRRAIMNDLAAGIGLEQLKKLPEFIKRRKQIRWLYDTMLPIDIIVPQNEMDNIFNNNSYYFHWIQTPRRDDLARFLRANEIYTSFRYYPLHRVFKTRQVLPGADYAADNTLLLPLHCNLTDSQVEYICDKVKEFFK